MMRRPIWKPVSGSRGSGKCRIATASKGAAGLPHRASGIRMSIESPTVAVPYEPLGRLFLRFLRFGFLAWGGPVVQIAMLRDSLVEQEKWVTSEHFNRVLA